VLRQKFTANFDRIDEGDVPSITLNPDNRTLARTAFLFTRDDETYFTALDLTGRFSTWGLKHTLLLGADYYRTNATSNFSEITIPDIDIFDPVYSGVVPVFPAAPDFFQKQEWYGVYFQDQIDLLDNLHLLGGGRYDDAIFEFDAREAFGSFAQADDTAFSPRVGIVYQPLPWLSLYGNYVESFGSENAFSVSADGKILDPETATQYEVGLKTELLDGKLSATLAFYELTKQNIATPDPDNPGFSILTGEARSRGIELDLSGRITPEWDVIASYAYTDAEITQDNSSNVGNKLPNVPEHGGSFWPATGSYKSLCAA
jgi:iron complex outermembrane receptor protein